MNPVASRHAREDMHSAAGYVEAGSLRQCAPLAALGSDRVHTTNRPYQSSLGRLSETTSSGGLSAAVFGVHPSPSAAFALTQTNPLGSRVQLGRPE